VSGGEHFMLSTLDVVSLNVVARAQRAARGFGWGDVLVVAATIIWGVNVVVVKLALTDSGPFTYSAIRYVLGGLALCGLARWLEGPLVRPRGTDAWLIAAAAAAGVLINQASFAEALALTNADNIAMISGTTPLLVVGWLVWRNREHFEAKVWAGLGLGLVGVVLVVGAAGGTWSSWLVVLVALAMPLSWAVYLLLLPRLLGRCRPLTLAAWITAVGAVMLIPFGAVEGLNRHPHVTGPWLGLLAYSALAAVALTAWLYLPGVRRLGPARTTVYSYLQPFLTVVAAGLLIGEPVLPLQLLGGVIMLVGVAMGRPRPHPGPVPLGDEPTVVAGVIAENLAVRVGTQQCAAPSGGSPGKPTKGDSRLVNMEGPVQSHVRS
jgi:drug/metabolite transporter (DMT)-like permease